MASNKRGVFTLSDIRERQRDNFWSSKKDVFFDARLNYGYISGGSFSPSIAIRKFSFASHTDFPTLGPSSFSNNLNTVEGDDQVAEHAATGNNYYGYFAGGIDYTYPNYGNTARSIISRLDYYNDTSPSSLVGGLNIPAWGMSASGNQSYGYFYGGISGPIFPSTYPSNLYITNTQRLDYSSDLSNCVLRASTPQSYRTVAIGNNQYGWITAGELHDTSFSTTRSIPHTNVYRITYNNDTLALQSRSTNGIRGEYDAATGNKSYGWFSGSWSRSSTVLVNGIYESYNQSNFHRLDFNNDTLGLSLTFYRLPVPENGGYRFSSLSSASDGYYFSSTTTSFPGLPQSTYGQFKINFSNESFSSTNATVSSHTYANVSPFHNGSPEIYSPIYAQTQPLESNYPPAPIVGNFLYTNGAYTKPFTSGVTLATGSTSLRRYEYSPLTGTSSGTYAYLNDSRTHITTIGNQLYGYFIGGFYANTYPINPPVNPVYYSSIERFDYSNFVGNVGLGSTLRFKGPASNPIASTLNVGNKNYGYLMGGFKGPQPVIITSVDRMDYTNDITLASVRLNLPLGVSDYLDASTGNQNYGYHNTGSTVQRLDYSNDILVLSRGNIASNYRNQSATGNKNFGYFAGGGQVVSSPFVLYSTVSRLDYSNDTGNLSARTNLAYAVAKPGSASSLTDAWFINGIVESNTPGSLTTMFFNKSRISYENETLFNAGIISFADSLYGVGYFSIASSLNYGVQ